MYNHVKEHLALLQLEIKILDLNNPRLTNGIDSMQQLHFLTDIISLTKIKVVIYIFDVGITFLEFGEHIGPYLLDHISVRFLAVAVRFLYIIIFLVIFFGKLLYVKPLEK